MIQFKTLEHIPIEMVTAALNDAFSDYVVPFSMSVTQMELKWRTESIALHLSVGAFNGDELVGFILHFWNPDENPTVVYNGGTGVRPPYRGQSLTYAMYNYCLPLLKKEGIHIVKLEVINSNTKAQNIYATIGFQATRMVHCFKGHYYNPSTNLNGHLADLSKVGWPLLNKWSQCQATWQNKVWVLKRMPEHVQLWGAIKDENCVGVVAYNSYSNRIHQIAVHPAFRRQGIASYLCAHVARLTEQPLLIMNVDSACNDLTSFFEKIGLEIFVSQYEMQWQIS